MNRQCIVRSAALAALLTFCCFGNLAQAATTYFWTTSTGTGGSETWDNANWETPMNTPPLVNWSGSQADTAEFYTGSGTVMLNSNQTVGNINFDATAGTYALTGGTITLGNGTGATISASQNATIGSLLAGNSQLFKEGPGTLYLSNSANTFSNGNGVSLNGGVLNFVNGALNNNQINCNGGTLQWATGNSQDVSNKINIGGANQMAYLDATGNSVTFSHQISGSGGLTLLGGQLFLNTLMQYTGPTNVNGGTLAYDSTAGGANDLATSSTLTINNGGAVAMLLGGLNVRNPVVINSGGHLLGGSSQYYQEGAVTLSGGTLSGYNPQLSGPIYITQNSTIDATAVNLQGPAGAFTLPANVTLYVPGSFTNSNTNLVLTSANSGTMILSNTGNNLSNVQAIINGGTLQLGDGVNNGDPHTTIVNNSCLVFAPGSAQYFGGNVSGSGVVTITAPTTALSLTLGGAISGSNSVNINSGANVILNALQTYTGPTNVNGGTLSYDSTAGGANDLSTSSTLTINNGGAVAMLLGGLNVRNPVVINSGGHLLGGSSGYYQEGAVTLSGGTLSGNSTQISGPIYITQNSTIDATGLQLSGPAGAITLPANVTLYVPGTLTNCSTNLVLTSANNGTMVLSNTGNNLSNVQAIINGGTLQVGDGVNNGSVHASIVNNSCLVFAPGSAQNFGDNVSGSGVVSINGPTTALSCTLGGAISGSNSVNINSGVNVHLYAYQTYSGPTNVNSGGTLSWVIPSNAYISPNSTLNVNNGGLVLVNVAGISLSGPVVINAGGQVTTPSGVGGGFGSTLTLAGGTLSGGGGGTAWENGWTLGGPVSVTQNSTISASDVSCANFSIATPFTIAPNVTLNVPGTIVSYSVGDNLTGLGLSSSSAGTMVLSGSNTYQNGTTINGGVLEAKYPYSLPRYNSNNSVVVAAGATVAVAVGAGEWTQTNVDNLRTSASIASGGFLGLDTTDGDFIYTTSIGSIGTGGAGGLVKLGSGMLTLTGASTYAGDTAVNGGTLAVNGSLWGSGNVAVNSGAVLSGSGIVGNLLVNSTGTLAPGLNASAGTLTATTLTLQPGSILNYTLGAAAGGNGFVSVGQNLQLAGNGINLVVSSGGLLSPNSYLLMSYGSLNNNAGGYPASSAFTLTNSAAYVPNGDTASVVSSANNTLDLVIAAAAPSVIAGSWTGTASTAVWSDSTQWSGNAVPGAHAGDTAAFGVTPTSGTATVTLDSSRSLAGLGFNTTSGSGYTINASSTSALTLVGSNGAVATISNSGGSQTITAPIVLGSNLNVTASTGSCADHRRGHHRDEPGHDALRQRRRGVGPQRHEPLHGRDDRQRRHARREQQQRLAQQRPADGRQRRAARAGRRLGHWRIARGLIASRFGRGGAQCGGVASGDDREPVWKHGDARRSLLRCHCKVAPAAPSAVPPRPCPSRGRSPCWRRPQRRPLWRR